jgi:hypothetical protein
MHTNFLNFNHEVYYKNKLNQILNSIVKPGARGGVVVEALRYKPEGRGFDSRWCY